MHIIFSELPSYATPIARLVRWFGHEVYYLRLSSTERCSGDEEKYADRLKLLGIIPLPLEFLPKFSGFSKCDSDPEQNASKKTCKLISPLLLKAFEKLYPNNKLVSEKLRIVVQSQVGSLQIYVAGKVSIWAGEHPKQKILLISLNYIDFLMPNMPANVWHAVIPIDVFSEGIRAIWSCVCRWIRRFRKTATANQNNELLFSLNSKHDFEQSQIVFVTHQGLSYGTLFQKIMYYSPDPSSKLFRNNLLHFDYSGCPSPSEQLKWVCLNSVPSPILSGVKNILYALSHTLLAARNWNQFLGCLVLCFMYARYKLYLAKLRIFSSLKVALIDYDMLCPKSLLLAFEAQGVKTVAAQERFIATFYTSFAMTILDSYLCGSNYAATQLGASPYYHAEHYIPVGQYRSDNFTKALQEAPPDILRRPKEEGKKIIIALGCHVHLRWDQSQTDPLINWSAHCHFLEEMIQLSRDISDVYLVLRFKSTDWVSLEIFSDIIQEIKSSENITIAMDYEKSFFSYNLCAHSHLVIAKHTSLGDECLSAGIPVLFHEYTHNTERLVADIFDYSPTKIMCFNYEELLARSKIILSGSPHAMTSDYEYLANTVYGGLGDGHVRERIHAYVNTLLAS